MSDKFLIYAAVYIAMLNDNKIFLMKRANTGYRDGEWCMPAGHIEANESPEEACARELMEETGISILDRELHFASSLFRQSYDRTYADYLFVTTKWGGQPKIVEPDKASEAGWFPLDDLPSEISAVERVMIENSKRGVPFASLMEKGLTK